MDSLALFPRVEGFTVIPLLPDFNDTKDEEQRTGSMFQCMQSMTNDACMRKKISIPIVLSQGLAR